MPFSPVRSEVLTQSLCRSTYSSADLSAPEASWTSILTDWDHVWDSSLLLPGLTFLHLFFCKDPTLKLNEWFQERSSVVHVYSPSDSLPFPLIWLCSLLYFLGFIKKSDILCDPVQNTQCNRCSFLLVPPQFGVHPPRFRDVVCPSIFVVSTTHSKRHSSCLSAKQPISHLVWETPAISSRNFNKQLSKNQSAKLMWAQAMWFVNFKLPSVRWRSDQIQFVWKQHRLVQRLGSCSSVASGGISASAARSGCVGWYELPQCSLVWSYFKLTRSWSVGGVKLKLK